MVVAVDDIVDARAIYHAILQHEPRAKLAPRTRWGTGPGAARNDAFAASSGRYIVMLDADDSLREDYLLRFAKFFREHPHATTALAPTRIVREDNHELRPLFVPNIGPEGTVSFREYECLIISTHVVCRRAAHIPWPESGYAEDVVRDALLVRQAESVAVLDTEYRALIHPGQYMQSGRSSEEEIRASYVRTAILYPELAMLFMRRAAANAYFAAHRRPNEEWYTFWSERHGEVPGLELVEAS